MKKVWMPLNVGDYLKDTRRLTAAQHGAYLLLIMEYWTAGNLPQDDGALARIACMTPNEWKKERAVIASFFGEQWTHKRINKELAKAAEISSKRRYAAEQRYCKTDAIAEQEHNNSIHTRDVFVSSLPSSVDSLSLEATQEEKACGKFAEFWKIYPHKVGKKDAEKSFAKALKTVDFTRLIAAVRVYGAKTDDRPWCNPATWLNQGRWDDQPAEPTRGGALGVLERIQRTLESDADSEAGEGVVVSLPQGRLSGC